MLTEPMGSVGWSVLLRDWRACAVTAQRQRRARAAVSASSVVNHGLWPLSGQRCNLVGSRVGPESASWRE